MFAARTSLLRNRAGHDGHRVGFVELFFDLVFVFAVTQLSHRLIADHSAGGLVETTLLFLAVWSLWINTTWVTNWLTPDGVPVRLLLFALMAAGLLLSTSLADAFGERALVFAGAFAAMQIGRDLFMLWALRHHNRANFRNFVRIIVWHAFACVFWLGGAFAGEHRLAAWLIAVTIDSLSPAIAFWVPGLGRSTIADWDVSPAHMAERCGLFIIIALGEGVLLTGAAFASHAQTPIATAALLAAFVGSVLIWRIYFTAAEHGGRRYEEVDDPGRLARLAYTYQHVPIVAGVINHGGRRGAAARPSRRRSGAARSADDRRRAGGLPGGNGAVQMGGVRARVLVAAGRRRAALRVDRGARRVHAAQHRGGRRRRAFRHRRSRHCRRTALSPGAGTRTERRRMKRLSFLIAALLAACATPPSAPLRMNDIQAIGTHNSYKAAISPQEMGLLRAVSPQAAAGLDYWHPPLTEQLDAGARVIEIDIVNDPEGGRFADPAGLRIARAQGLEPPAYDTSVMAAPGFKAIHVQDIDYRSVCQLFLACLRELRAWSDAHRDHAPILVMMNLKRGPSPAPGGVEAPGFDDAAFDALDADVRAGIGAERLITPDDVQGAFPTLREAVLAGNWPELGAARGRFFFVLDEGEDMAAAYRGARRNLEGRVFFVNVAEDSPVAAYLTLNDPIAQAERIRAAVAAGFIVRTRADADTVEARANDTRRREAAFASGAQYVSTDYMTPRADFGPYSVSMPEVARCNPVRARCAGRVIEAK
jgi:low temperature requirement protein LtrA